MTNKTSDILIKYLKEKNISQVMLAKLINVTPQYINSILKDKKTLSKNTFNKIVKTLKITENDRDEIIKYEYSKKNIKIDTYKNQIKQFGVYTDFGFQLIFNDIFINLLNFEKNIEMFFIKIETDKLENLYNNEYIFFHKITEFIENNIYLIEIDNIIELTYLEFIDNKLVIRFLNKDLNSKIISKSKIRKLKIIGKFVGRYTMK